LHPPNPEQGLLLEAVQVLYKGIQLGRLAVGRSGAY